jgi:serine/threonine protein phosphatase PrpC/CRP-like cAMP-binding protein
LPSLLLFSITYPDIINTLRNCIPLRCVSSSRRGFYPENHGKPNQDAWCLTTQWGGLDRDAFFAVFDGHGPFGHDCANYAKKNLPNGVAKYIRSNRLKFNNSPQAPPSSAAASRQSSISSLRSSAHARNKFQEEEEKVPENGDVAAPSNSRNKESARSSAPAAGSKKGWDPKSWPMLSQIMLEECLRRGHLDCNTNMRSNELIKDKLSGTTAISAAFHNNMMTICNVGDSRAIVGRRVHVNVDPERVPQVLEYLVPESEAGAKASESFSPPPRARASDEASPERNTTSAFKSFTSSTEDMIEVGFKVTTLKSTALSVDQTPYRTDELERVKKAGARVLSLDQLEGVEPIHENWRKLDLGEDIDVEGDPPRVWVQDGEYPGTAFTRSIGDAEADAIGVTAEPEIQTVKLTPEDKLIILASDGIFEFLPNQDVIDICALYPNDPLQAANAVVKKAYDLWLTYELRTDDITIIVMMLDWHEETNASAGGGDNSTNELPPPMVPHNLLVEPKKGAIASLKTMEQQENQRAKKLCEKPSSGYRASATLKNMLQEELLTGVLEFTPCFANMTEDQGNLILKAMESLTLKAGEFLVKEGEINDFFYSLEEGKLGVRTQKDSPGEDADVDEAKGGVLVHTLVRDDGIGPCPTLGEVALIQTIPSAYSIAAETDCTLWSLHRTAFQTVRSEMNLNYRRILYYKLSQMKELHALNPIHIWKLVKNMETVEVSQFVEDWCRWIS